MVKLATRLTHHSHKKILPIEDRLFRLMSFNVCLCASGDSGNWDKRKNQVASTIRFHKVDLAGLQEPNAMQIEELAELLPDFEWYGVCLEDGCSRGSLNPIIYKKSRFELLEASYFYLSQVPDSCAIGWDAKYPRGTTWVKLRDRNSGQIFYFFNTHFDYHGTDSRENSADLLIQKIKEIVGDYPYVVTGDFNIFPSMRGDVTYNKLTKDSLLMDAQIKTRHPHHGPTGSWSGFKEAGQPGIKPDYIFVRPDTIVETHGILSDNFDGDFPSDHLPIVADIALGG
jgi:endonuclease/exonuclease/phosphatase family metal-dependent hydrolase